MRELGESVNTGIFEEISKLLSIAKVGPSDTEDKGLAVVFGLGQESIGFYEEENTKTFNSITKTIWKDNDQLFSTFTLKTVRKRIGELLLEHFFDGKTLDQQRVDGFISDLLSEPVEEWEVFRPLYGAILPTDSDPLVMGPIKKVF